MNIGSERLQIAAVISKPLRFQGLRLLFHHFADFYPILPTEAVRRFDLSMLILDSDELPFPLLGAFRRARAGLRILVLGDSTEPKYISRIIAAGAKGYLPHVATAAEMETAIRVVADGSIWAPRKVLSGLIDTLSSFEPVRRDQVHFTPRERDLLQRLVLGLPDREIARELGLSVRTIQAMVRALLQRVGVTNRVALTIYVMEKHLVSC